MLVLTFVISIITAQHNLHAENKSPVTAKATIASMYKKVTPSTVGILVNNHLNGTGWIATADGYVITAAHVVAGNSDKQLIEIINKSNGRVMAKKVAIDKGHDLALLKLPTKRGGYPAVSIAKTMGTTGDEIYLLGTPIYRHGVLTPGRIARPTTAYEYLADNKHYIETVYVNAHTPRGTSGGPWFNLQGEIVGLQSAMMNDGKSPAGIAFVIPLKAIKKLLDEKKSAATQTLKLAIEEIWEQPGDFLKKYPNKTQGLVIHKIASDSPLKTTDLKDGQVIIAVNDKPISLRDELLIAIRKTKPGQSLKLTYLKPNSIKRHFASVTPEVWEK